MMKKNVLLIMCDALRADVLGCYNGKKHISPNIDKLAKDGVLFQNAVAPSCGTSPSVPAILTSIYPSLHGRYFCSSSKNLISGLLRENGWDTGAIVSNAYLSRLYGYDKGFNYFKYLSGGKGHPINRIYKSLLRKQASTNGLIHKLLETSTKFFPPLPPFALPYGTATEINKKAFSWLNTQSKNFFLWLHYMEPHGPYYPPPSYLSQIGEKKMNRREILDLNSEDLDDSKISKLKKLYYAEIAFLDERLGSLFQHLKKKDLWEESIIILTADHGEAFGEHRFFNHPHELYEELIHVPLILFSPKLDHKIINQPVSLLDIPPTICDLLEIESPTHFQGVSLLPLVKGKTLNRKGVISEAFQKKYEGTTKIGKHRCSLSDVGKLSYRTKKWKYIYNLEESEEELYDLKSDLEEQRNLNKRKKKTTEKFRGKLDKHILKQYKRIKLSKDKIKQGLSKIKREIH